MKNILIVKWCDVTLDEVREVALLGKYDHDDIVRILLHIETEIQQREKKIVLK